MGALDRLRGLLVYLDANIIIYIVEGYATHRAILRDLVKALDDRAFRAMTSELTLAEVLVGAFRAPDRRYEAVYSNVLSGREPIEVIPVGRDILIGAARLRAESRMRLPDAIHVATARTHQCDLLLTNDHRLQAAAGVTVVTLAELTAA